MADRIDTSSTPPPRRAEATRASGAQQTSNRDAPVDEVAATTAVTTQDTEINSTLVQRLQEEVTAAGEIDRQKVENIKQAISSGEFVVDPGRVASAFIQVEALLA